MTGNIKRAEKRPGLGAVMVLLSGLSWAPVAVVGKICIRQGVGEVSLNVVRVTISAIIVGVMLLASRRSRIPIPLRCRVIASLFGALVFAVGGLSFFASLRFIDASMAYLLAYTHPAMVLLASLALGWERFSVFRILAVILTFAGVALVLQAEFSASGGIWVGVGLVLLTAAIYSAYVLVSDKLLSRHPSRQISFYSLAAAAFVMLAVAPFQAEGLDLVLSDLLLMSLVAAAALGTGLSLVFLLAGVRHVGATLASIISSVNPVFVVLLAWLVLDEALTAVQLLGVGLLMAGVLLARQTGEPVVETAT